MRHPAKQALRRVRGGLRPVVDRWRGHGRTLPDYLIVGAMRSGTTSVHGWLGGHPQVAVTEKEIRFFNLNAARGTSWYRSHFPRERECEAFAREHGAPLLVGDATASYLLHYRTPQRAAELVPDARIIVCLRDPVDRAYSQFHAIRRRGHETLESFEAAVDAEEERLRGEEERVAADPSYRSWALHVFSYLKGGRYAEQLERWYAAFPREQVLVLGFEREIAGAPEQALQRVHDHLGLPAHRHPDLPVLNMLAVTYDPLPGPTRDRLVEHFRPHNRRLYELTGVDFGWPA